MPTYDVVVVGLGAHGSAIAAHAAVSGLKVCGLDRAQPPHTGASHHGESRIIRKAYYEDAAYVPLLERAYVLWDALAATTHEPVMRRTGGLMMGPPDGELVPGSLSSAREHRLAHEWLDQRALSTRFPAFRAFPGMEGVYEPDAGILFPEACVRAHLGMASRAGAVLRPNVDVKAIDVTDHGIELECALPNGTHEVMHARRGVVAAGSGLTALRLSLSPLARVERQVVAHFQPMAMEAAFRELPIFALEEPDLRFYYGFADLGNGVKVAQHHGGTQRQGDLVDMTVRAEDVANLRRFLADRLPAADGAMLAASVCRYTNLPDGHFAIDRRDPRLLVVSACSGHGFKFASVMGEICALLLQDRRVPFDLSLFDARRFERA